MSKSPPIPKTQRAGHGSANVEAALRSDRSDDHTDRGRSELGGAGHQANIRQNTNPARTLQDR